LYEFSTLTNSDQNAVDFANLAQCILRKLIGRANQNFIEISTDIVDFKIQEVNGSTILTVSEYSSTFDGISLAKLQQNLLADIISCFKLFPFDTCA